MGNKKSSPVHHHHSTVKQDNSHLAAQANERARKAEAAANERARIAEAATQERMQAQRLAAEKAAADMRAAHEKQMKALENQNKADKRKAIGASIANMENKIRNIDQVLSTAGTELTKQGKIQKGLTEQKDVLTGKINSFDTYKTERLEEFKVEKGYAAAEYAYDRDNNEVKDAIEKTGVHSNDVGKFLVLTHGLMGATMSTQAEANRLEAEFTTFASILNNECQDKLTITHYFNEKNLKPFVQILKTEGYQVVEDLLCDEKEEFEHDILTLLDKGIQTREKNSRIDAVHQIKELETKLTSEKDNLAKLTEKLTEFCDEKQAQTETQTETPTQEQMKKSKEIQHLNEQKIQASTNISTFGRLLRKQKAILNALDDKEKQRQSKNADQNGAEHTPQTNKTGDDLCRFLLKEWGFKDECWDQFKEEGWDDAEDWHEIEEEDLKNDLGITKKPKIKKFMRMSKKWHAQSENREQEQKQREVGQNKGSQFLYLKAMEQKMLKKICLSPGRKEWGQWEIEKARVVKVSLLQLSPVLGQFFGKMNTAIKDTQDLINYKKELSGAQLKAIQMKDANDKKLKAIEWRREDVDSRKKWRENSKCEIYSDSSKQWHNGTILEVNADSEGEWLKIEYEINNETRTKEVQRYNDSVRSSKVEEEKCEPETDMIVAKREESDNPIAIQSGALITASIISVNVSDTMLQEFSVSPITERGLGLAHGVEDCCKQLIKNQGEIRQSVFLGQEILKYKPANMSNPKTIQLWSAVDAGIVRIFSSAIEMVRVAANYFGFFLRFQNSFQFFVSCYANGEDVALFTSLERLKADLREFNAFKDNFSKSVIELNATAMDCIGNCVKESIGYLNWEQTQNSLRKTEETYLSVRKLCDNKSLALDNELDDIKTKKIEVVADEGRALQHISILNARIQQNQNHKEQCVNVISDLNRALKAI